MSWRQASDSMRKALRTAVVPVLRERGFRGSFPNLYRVRESHIDLLTFQFSQFGPNLYIEIASVPAGTAEHRRVAPSKLRRGDAGLYFRRIGPMPSIDFEGVRDANGATSQVHAVLRAISVEGESWWLSPTPAVVLPNPSLERP